VLLSEKPHTVDHLLGAGSRGLETGIETRVLALEELNSLRRHDTFHTGCFETLETRFRLKRSAAKGRELVTEMLDELLQLREGGYFRTCAV
jgi:hypothetical protein